MMDISPAFPQDLLTVVRTEAEQAIPSFPELGSGWTLGRAYCDQDSQGNVRDYCFQWDQDGTGWHFIVNVRPILVQQHRWSQVKGFVFNSISHIAHGIARKGNT